MASSFSFFGAPISKRVRTEATLRKMARIAKNLPGQILSDEIFQYGKGWDWAIREPENRRRKIRTFFPSRRFSVRDP
jgi:hypothetical protein